MRSPADLYSAPICIVHQSLQELTQNGEGLPQLRFTDFPSNLLTCKTVHSELREARLKRCLHTDLLAEVQHLQASA